MFDAITLLIGLRCLVCLDHHYHLITLKKTCGGRDVVQQLTDSGHVLTRFGAYRQNFAKKICVLTSVAPHHMPLLRAKPAGRRLIFIPAGGRGLTFLSTLFDVI